MDHRDEKTKGRGQRMAFKKPRLQTYDQGGFRARTAQGTQQRISTSPVNPMGLQLGGS